MLTVHNELLYRICRMILVPLVTMICWFIKEPSDASSTPLQIMIYPLVSRISAYFKSKVMHVIPCLKVVWHILIHPPFSPFLYAFFILLHTIPVGQNGESYTSIPDRIRGCSTISTITRRGLGEWRLPPSSLPILGFTLI